jgi:biotin carboxyl carrier protein
VCLAGGSPSGRLRLSRVHRLLGAPVCSPADAEAADARLVLALDVGPAELAVLRKHLPHVPAWLLVNCGELPAGEPAAWSYHCGAALDDTGLITLVKWALAPPRHVPQAPPSPQGAGEARVMRDVLDAVRDVSVLVDADVAAGALVRAVLSLTAADRAWCWFYDADGGTLFEGGNAEAPQIAAERGLIALAARCKVTIVAPTASQHPCFGGSIDLAHLGVEDHVMCQSVVGPDGNCHAVLVATRGSTRDMFSESEQAALATLGHYAGSALGQLALRGQIDHLIGEADPTFRREALDAHDTRADAGDVVRISPRWLNHAYWVLCALVAVAFAFLFVGRINQYASGVAVVRAENRVGVVANVAGTVEAVLVKSGDAVKEGQPLAILYSQQETQSVSVLDEQWETQLRHYLLEPGSESVRQTLASLRSQRQVARQRLAERQVRAPRAGVIGDVHTRLGAPLAPGEVVASIIDARPKFGMVAFLPANDAPQIQVGMPLRLELVGYPYAYVQLRVASVSREAAGQATVSRQLGPLLADTLGTMPATVMVEARFDDDHFRVDGRDYYFREGMPARAEVRIRSETIALSLVPWLRTVMQ